MNLSRLNIDFDVGKLADQSWQQTNTSDPFGHAHQSSPSSEFEPSNDFSVKLVTYVVPLFIVVGLIGNSLTIAVLMRRGVRKSTTIFYLTALSISDVISIVIGLPTYWLNEVMQIRLRDMHHIICKLHPFLVYSTTHCIVWILVLVTVDRLLWVAVPFRAKDICTLRNATIAMVVTAGVLLATNSHFLWVLSLQTLNDTTGEAVTVCLPSSEYVFFSGYVVPLIDLFVYSVLPFTIMIVSNVIIICKLHFYATKRNLTLKKSSSSLNSLNTTSNHLCRITSNGYNVGLCRMQSLPQAESCTSVSTIGTSHHVNVLVKPASAMRSRRLRRLSLTKMSRESHLTTMLLTVNIFFILTTLPVTVCNILYRVFEEDQLQDLQWEQTFRRFQTIADLLNYLNITVHFVLYCLSGKAFRDDVLILLKLRKPTQPIKRQLERLTSIQPDYTTCGF